MTNLDLTAAILKSKGPDPAHNTPLGDVAAINIMSQNLEDMLIRMMRQDSPITREHLMDCMGRIYLHYYSLLGHLDMTRLEVEEFTLQMLTTGRW